jgi:hypothetical protein
VKELHEKEIEWVKGYKEHVVRTNDDDDFDIPTIIKFFRDGVEIASAILRPDRDNMLDCAGVCIPGFRAELVHLFFETYNTFTKDKERTLVNPLTGKQYGPGEMQAVWRVQQETGENYGVMESITMFTYRNDLSFWSTTLPYIRDGRTLVWDEEAFTTFEAHGEEEGNTRSEGLVVDALQQCFISAQVFTVQMYQNMIEKNGLDPEAADALADAVTLRATLDKGVKGGVALNVEPGSKRDFLLREAMQMMGLADHQIQAVDLEDQNE